MAAASHPPGTLPPPSSRHGHMGGAPDPYGASSHYGSDARGRGQHHTGGQYGTYPYGSPPPPPPPPYEPSRGEAWTQPGGGSGGPLGAIPSTVYVAPPKLEMQPWARNVWRWLVDNTTGVARVDLRRPTPPLPEQYDGNLLVVRSRRSIAAAHGGGAGRGGFKQQRDRGGVPAYTAPPYGQGYGGAASAPMAPTAALSPQGQPLLMGARIKITRRFLIGGGKGAPSGHGHGHGDATSSSASEAESPAAALAAPPPAAGDAPPAHKSHSGGATAGPSPSVGATTNANASAAAPEQRPRHLLSKLTHGSPLARSWAEKPLLDLGVGVNLDVDQQQIQPVARIKIKDLISIKAAPMGLLKISRGIPMGPVALKVRYELPLAHAKHFWEPPARLMVRLDNAAGSGFHLTPGGLEFDEQVVQFGSAVSLRASASLAFPRQLPLEEGEPLFRLQLHRLSLRSIW